MGEGDRGMTHKVKGRGKDAALNQEQELRKEEQMSEQQEPLGD